MTNGEIVRRVDDAFARGDAPGVLAALDPQIRWMEAANFIDADANPYSDPQRVAEGIFARIGAEWAGFPIELQRIIDAGDTVVSLGRYRGTHKASREPVDARYVHVWDLRGGRVVSFQQYTDTLQFARIAGALAA